MFCGVSLCVYMCMPATARVWRSENNWWLALSGHHAGPRDQTWVVRVESRYLYPAKPSRLSVAVLHLSPFISLGRIQSQRVGRAAFRTLGGKLLETPS